MKQVFLLTSCFLLFITPLVFAQENNSASRQIDSLENALKAAKEDTSKVLLLNQLSNKYMGISNFDKERALAEEALKLSEKIEYKRGIGISHANIGLSYYNQGDYDKAMKHREEELRVFREMDDTLSIAKALQNIGNIHWGKANYSAALNNYIEALKTYEQVHNKGGVATMYISIGVIYYYQQNYDKALEYYEQALPVLEELGNKQYVGLLLNNMGAIYRIKNDYDKALEYYNNSLKIREAINDKVGIAECLGNTAGLLSAQEKYGEALEYAVRALKIQEEMGNKKDMAESLVNISQSYTHLKNYNKALEYAQRGLELALQIGSKEDMRNSYKSLSEVYVKLGKYKEAFEYHRLFSEVKDSIFNAESHKQLAEMQTKYDTEKKEKEIQLLQKDKEIQQTEIARQKLVRNAVAGGLILVAAFAFVLFNRFRLIRKQKKIIEAEREKSENLLLNILPKDTAEELKATGKAQPKQYDTVTVMFTDFKGFTTIAEKMNAEQLVSELDFIFKKFDQIISRYPIEKIKTIGDAYMCAGGLPVANTTNPVDVVMAALDIQQFMQEHNEQRAKENKPLFQVRIGVHTGPVIAGVVGDKKFAYDIWGDTVNTASRMESSGEPGKVNISGETSRYLTNLSGFENLADLEFIFRGKIPAKNKGEIEMYFVQRKK